MPPRIIPSNNNVDEWGVMHRRTLQHYDVLSESSIPSGNHGGHKLRGVDDSSRMRLHVDSHTYQRRANFA